MDHQPELEQGVGDVEQQAAAVQGAHVDQGVVRRRGVIQRHFGLQAGGGALAVQRPPHALQQVVHRPLARQDRVQALVETRPRVGRQGGVLAVEVRQAEDVQRDAGAAGGDVRARDVQPAGREHAGQHGEQPGPVARDQRQFAVLLFGHVGQVGAVRLARGVGQRPFVAGHEMEMPGCCVLGRGQKVAVRHVVQETGDFRLGRRGGQRGANPVFAAA